MEKKKLKLSISGASKKTINSIRGARPVDNKSQSTFIPKKTNFSKPSSPITSDFEKRKLAEQRATRRLKGENVQKVKEESSS